MKPARGRPSKGSANHKYCFYGTCKSNGKINPALKFVPFPKPCKEYYDKLFSNLLNNTHEIHQTSKCSQCTTSKHWLHLCRRDDRGLSKLSDITRNTFVCTKHFVDENGPTPDYPDPFPANMDESTQERKRRVRKAPRHRDPLQVPRKCRKTSAVPEVHSSAVESSIDNIDCSDQLLPSIAEDESTISNSPISRPKEMQDSSMQTEPNYDLQNFANQFNSDWAVQCKSDQANFFLITNQNGKMNAMIHVSVTQVSHNLQCAVFVLDNLLPLGDEIAKQTDIKSALEGVKNLLHEIKSKTLCAGITKTDLKEAFNTILKPKNGKFCYKTEAVRSLSCELFPNGQVCVECVKYAKCLRVLAHRASNNTQEKSNSFCNNRYLSKSSLILKVNKYKKEVLAAGEKIKRVHDKLRKLTDEGCKVGNGDNDFHNILTSVENIFPPNSFQAIFIKEQLKAARRKTRNGFKWHPMIMKQCLYLQQKSPGTYRALRESGFIILPSQRTLYDYNKHLESESGFPDNLPAQVLAELAKLPDDARYCALVPGDVCGKEDYMVAPYEQPIML